MNLTEKVARAMAVLGGYDPDEIIGVNENDVVPRWRVHIPDARAALDAIAEPSEAMYAAGQDALQEGHAADEIFRRMIAKGREG